MQCKQTSVYILTELRGANVLILFVPRCLLANCLQGADWRDPASYIPDGYIVNRQRMRVCINLTCFA